MAYIRHHSVVFHFFHVLQSYNVFVSCRCDKNIYFVNHAFHSFHYETFHASLQGTYGVDFRYINNSAWALKSLCTALANVSIPTHHYFLTANQHVSCSINSVNHAVPAPVFIIKLGLCHRVIDVNCHKGQNVLLAHVFKSVDTRRGFFTNSLNFAR